jgi:hydrogenase-1 operon protein HyaF
MSGPSQSAQAVLREISSALGALARQGAAAPPHAIEETIDLHSLPLSEADRAALATRLGRGEVQATLDVAGATRVFETAFAGVWWVEHADAQGHTMLEQVVVARVPALLPAHPADIESAARRLQAELESTHE